MFDIDKILFMRNSGKILPDAKIEDILFAKKLQSAMEKIVTILGNPLSFLAKKAQTAKSTKVTLEPVQAGSGDPSPTNICPIFGRSSVEINGCGATVWNGFYEDGNILSDGSDGTSNSYKRTGYIKVKGNVSYYLVCNDIYKRIYWYNANKNFISSNISITTVKTSPSNAVYARSMFQKTTDPNPNESCSLNYPSTDTQYHAYQQSNNVTITFPVMGENLVAPITEQTITRQTIIQTLQISKEGKFVASIYAKNNTDIRGNFLCRIMNNSTVVAEYSEDIPSENDGIITCEFTISDMDYTGIQFHISSASAGYSITVSDLQFKVDDHTVYGGTLDVETGVLTVDRVRLLDANIGWSFESTWNVFYRTLTGYDITVSPQSNIYKSATGAPGAQAAYNKGNCTICVKNLGTTNVIYIRDDAYTDAQTFMAAIKDIQIAYALATPRTIQLTPEQIQILKGQNNIWIEDEGASIELTYKA